MLVYSIPTESVLLIYYLQINLRAVLTSSDIDLFSSQDQLRLKILFRWADLP